MTDEIPELKEVELILNGSDIAALMILCCQNMVSGLATLLNILQRRGVPDTDPEVVKMHNDYFEYLERLETALAIQAKLQEMKGGVVKPQPWDVGYG
jgi:hypothetical protein